MAISPADLMGLTVAELTALRAALYASLIGNLDVVNYSIAGRSIGKTSRTEILQMLAACATALDLASGTVQRVVYADMSNTPG